MSDLFEVLTRGISRFLINSSLSVQFLRVLVQTNYGIPGRLKKKKKKKKSYRIPSFF
jgi:hypothetical protein